MKSFDINNEIVVDLLEKWRYTYLEKYSVKDTNLIMGNPDLSQLKRDGDRFTSQEEMHRVIDMKEAHDGAAFSSYSIALKPEHYNGDDVSNYNKDYADLNWEMQSELGTHQSALSQHYPVGGFIGWHNNANASAYNLIFTWSENGDGWFKYLDPRTNKIVTMQDKKGWTLKAGYFGSYSEPRKVMYHCAKTNCNRITLSYTTGHDVEYWKDCVEHITTK